MGVQKGTDNFKIFRERKVAGNMLLVRAALERSRKRKQPYPKLSVLVSDMAERTGIHRTTLTGNPAYLKELLTYLASQPGASYAVSDEDASPELLRAKLLDMRLEIKKLTKQVAESKKIMDASQDKFPLVANASADTPDWYLAFSNTAMTLKLLIEKLNSEFEIIRVDFQTAEILELSAPRGRQLIAGGDRTRSFIEFYRTLLVQEGKLKKK